MNERGGSGAAWMALASVLFAGMGLLVKVAVAEVPTGQVVLWRNAVSLVLLTPWVLADPGILRARRAWPIVVRSLSGVASMYCYFTAIGRLPLGDAVTISYVSPLLVALISPRILGEPTTPGLWRALGLGFLGVVLVARPAFSGDPLGVLAAVATAFLAAVAYVYVRVSTRADASRTIVWWFSALSTVAAVPSLAFAEGPPSGWMVVVLVGVGLLGLLAQLAMTRAYALQDAAVVSLFSYLTPVMAWVLGVLALGERPGLGAMVGMGLVVAAGVLVMRSPPTDAAPRDTATRAA